MNTVHKTVLLHETIDGLAITPQDIVVDATLNAAGHTKEVIHRFADKVKIYGIDADSDALLRAQNTLANTKSNVTFILSNFRNLKKVLEKEHVSKVHRFIFDLGLSSDQLETSGRGFSFRKEEPLLMTFSKNPTPDELTAEYVVNEFQEENLVTVIRGFGEEKFAYRIAKAIVKARELNPIKTSKELADIVTSAVPMFYRKGKIHPATKTFQAIRMVVNNELEVLEQTLKDAFELLSPGGRIAVITFHSLEDRVVKHIFKLYKDQNQGILINKKPILPTPQEISSNPRSRSAKLRIIQKNDEQ
jgi:16S rRNA (cytosine1402-N4)-methyltransferase